MNQKNLAVITISLCIGFGMGFFANRTLQSSTVSDQAAQIQIQNLQSQIEQAKKSFSSLPASLSALPGTITDISGDVITLETNLSVSPFENFPKVRRVTVKKDTIISRLVQKDYAIFQKEIKEFQKKALDVGVQPDSAPDFYIFSPGSRADLKKGMSVMVTAGEDVKQKEAFDAKEIQIRFQPNGAPMIIR